MENLADPRTDLRGLLPRARPGRRRGGAGRRGAGRAVPRPRHDVRRARRRARRDIQETITTGPAALDAGIRGFPVQRPFLRNSELLFARAAPGHPRAAQRRAGPRRRVRGGPAGAAALGRAQPPPRCRRSSRCRTFAEDPHDLARHQRPAHHRADPQPDGRRPRAGPDRLQLRDALVPQRRAPALRGRQQRHLAAVHHRRRAARAPTTRAARRRAPGQRRPATGRELPALRTRTRTRRAAAARTSARPATSRG